MKNKCKILSAAFSLATALVIPMSAISFNALADDEPKELTKTNQSDTTDVDMNVSEGYIVTIPATVELGNKAKIKAENVVITKSEELKVTLSATSEEDNSFKLKTEDGERELVYTVTKGEEDEEEQVGVGSVVLTVPANDEDKQEEVELNFNEPDGNVLAGDYSGTVTFTVGIEHEKVNIDGLTLSPSELSLTKGGSQKITATVSPDEAGVDKTVTWESSNEDVATVDGNGQVTAVGTGTATITATATNGTDDIEDDIAESITVTVTNPATDIEITSAGGSSVVKGGTLQLGITRTPTDADEDTIEWKSDNESVATVDSDGLVTAVNGGSATITATDSHGSLDTYDISVTVPLESISITGAPTSAMNYNGTAQLGVTFNPSDTTDDKTIEWTSSDTSVATVNSSGEVTAVGGGTVTITARATKGTEDTSDDETATVEITVNVNLSGDTITSLRTTLGANGGSATYGDLTIKRTSTGNGNNATHQFGFTVPDGKKITKITITGSDNLRYSTGNNTNAGWSGGGSTTITWQGTASNEVSVTVSNRNLNNFLSRMSTIVVEYE